MTINVNGDVIIGVFNVIVTSATGFVKLSSCHLFDVANLASTCFVFLRSQELFVRGLEMHSSLFLPTRNKTYSNQDRLFLSPDKAARLPHNRWSVRVLQISRDAWRIAGRVWSPITSNQYFTLSCVLIVSKTYHN